MKPILIILLTFASITGTCQYSNNNTVNIVGIWTLTDYNNPNKFEDTWEFRADGIFNELKYRAGDTTLIPDENGTWTIKGRKLKIWVTGEETRGDQKLYNEPQLMEFEIVREKSIYVLTVIAKEGSKSGKPIKLRLTRK